MTQPVPLRATEAVRETRPDGSVVETVRTVEFAAQAPPGPPAGGSRALDGGPRGYDPVRDSPAGRSGVLRLDHAGDEPRRALPPGSPAPARTWRPGWWPW